ncbi:MAG: ribbon-helix-helix protein, CopG family [Aquificales bacterium]|nr:ribbon-helix-helix protein, CopG family [Aquificales bacterium]
MNEKMVRTQVYLPRDMYEHLKQRADEDGITMAHQIREAVALYVVETEEEIEDESKYAIPDDDPIWDMIGMCKDGPEDGSVNHDKYIYTRYWDPEGDEL